MYKKQAYVILKKYILFRVRNSCCSKADGIGLEEYLLRENSTRYSNFQEPTDIYYVYSHIVYNKNTRKEYYKILHK